MLTIGVELNHVVRNVNRQLLRYYQKEFDPSLDIDELDDRVDVIEKYMKFKSKKEKTEPIGATNNDKIVMHGFDTKTSFRGR